MTGVDPLADLQRALGHEFADPALLDLALMHRSHSAEHEVDESYERLEFLGDAVLQLAVTHYLYRAYPDLPEGEMAKVRASVVSEPALAELARAFGVGPVVKLGKGEEATGGREKSSILADAMESLLGAVYLDAGFDRARMVVMEHWTDLIDRRATDPGRRDYKTRLQEVLAREGLRPEYSVTDEGPEHAKVFTATVTDGASVIGLGKGTSKKRAEQAAAREALLGLGPGDA